jgi:hypothetical protein
MTKMNKYLFGLIGFALLGANPALGQTEPPLPAAPGAEVAGIAAPAARPLGANPALGQTEPPLPAAPGAEVAGIAASPIGPSSAASARTKTICVPEHYVKKTAKILYSSGSETLCRPYCTGLFARLGWHSGHCGHTYTRRYLIKKVQIKEEDAIRCVPKEVPAADHGHHLHE